MVKARYMITVSVDETYKDKYEKLRRKGVKGVEIVRKGIDKALMEKMAENKI